MKHVVLSDTFAFSADPFPAFRANLVYGRNKRDREFLPVKGVVPVTRYTVVSNYRTQKTVLYDGTDQTAAEAAQAAYDTRPVALVGDDCSATGTHRWSEYDKARLTTAPATLPEDKFRVIKTKEKNTILIVPGNDDTNRCLLFVGCAGGFRGAIGLVSEGTTGNVLKECSAGNACESRCEIIALLEVGQSVAFHTSGRRTNEVYVYTWNGADVEKKHFSNEEWRTRNAVAAPPIEDAEVL